MRHLEATGLHIAVSKSSGLAAIQFFSPRGTTVVRLPLTAFIEASRAPVDGNGQPFPQIKDIARADTREQLREDAEASRSLLTDRALPVIAEVAFNDGTRPLVAPKRRGRGRRLRIVGEVRERYLAAYADLQHTPGARWREIAEKHGLPRVAAWQTWCSDNRAECHKYLLDHPAPYLKPGGKIL